MNLDDTRDPEPSNAIASALRNAKVGEYYIRLHIQPRPKLVPLFLWRLLVKRVTFLSMFKERKNEK